MTFCNIDDQTKIVKRAEAYALGLKQYFTGKPCKNGHVANRQTSDGKCMECSKIKCKETYWRDPKKARTRVLKYCSDNLEKKRAYKRQWRKNNPDRVREYKKEQYYKDVSKSREVKRIDFQKHKEKRLESKRLRYHEDKSKDAAQAKRWRQENPERAGAIKRNYKARKRSATGSHSGADVIDLKRIQKGKCAMCGKPLGKAGHVDHIIPLNKGGSNDRKNLQWLCAPCNISKCDRDPLEFARLRGFLI